MSKLRIGIVGAGRIGNVHAESITYHIPEAEVVMVTDVNARENVKNFALGKGKTVDIEKKGQDFYLTIK